MKIYLYSIINLIFLSWLFLFPSTALSDQDHPVTSNQGKGLGKVHFAVSCKTDTQKQFNNAVALLHSFWYEAAEKAFQEVIRMEPDCAMGYWGAAMSLYHPLWAPPSPEALKKGQEAVEKAKAAKVQSKREKAYIQAMEAYYKDYSSKEPRARAMAYAEAMEKVHRSYPEDLEASVFYALALIGTALPTDKTYANQKKAAALLDKVFTRNPEHPGAAHYLIHSYDSPQLAELALAAARRYAKIAPASPHAQHMPSHIFVRLGLWDEVIASNLDSVKSARLVSNLQTGAASFEQLHALDYLAYAYLQGEENRRVVQLLENLRTIEEVNGENFASAYALSSIPVRYILENRKWGEATKLNLNPPDFPWKRFQYAEAVIYYGKAIGSARTGNVAEAQLNIQALEEIRKNLLEGKDSYWADQVEVQRLSAAAWAAQAEGKRDEALKLMTSAADLEDSMEKHPVTPGAMLPARELLGDLLLDLDQPGQALKEYEASLRSSPNRFNSFYGAARAAMKSGDPLKAKSYYQQLIGLISRGDGERKEIQEARGYLEKAN